MNKQSLYVFGGALLASTALATGAQAALIKSGTGLAAASNPGTVAVTAKGLATQVFGTTGQGAVTVGTTTQAILIDYNSQLTSVFNIQLDVAGAEFSTSSLTLTHYVQSTAGGTLRAASVTGCSTQVLSDKVLISGCDPTGGFTALGASLSRVDAIQVAGLNFVSLGALATAGTSVTLSGVVRNSANTITFENITSAAYITSKSAATASVTAGAAITVDNTASPAFTSLTATGNSLTAALGSIQFSQTGAVGVDLSLVLATGSLSSVAEVKITHGVLSDDAINVIYVGTAGGTPTAKSAANFASGVVSFQVPGASLNNADIRATFNGTATIDASSGSATVTPTILAPMASAVGSFSGALATLSRGGLSIQLNTVLSSGATGYSSFIRVANTSLISGTALVTVTNDATGAALGSYTTATIPAGGTLTISSSAIETALSLTASASVNYKVTVSGSFNGYAQHLVYNSVSGVFSDFSGFRKGALTLEP